MDFGCSEETLEERNDQACFPTPASKPNGSMLSQKPLSKIFLVLASVLLRIEEAFCIWKALSEAPALMSWSTCSGL